MQNLPMTFAEYVLIFCLTVVCCPLWSQSFEAVGKVVDQADSEAIEYASVSFYLAEDSSLIAGTITDEEGQFTLPGLVKAPMF